MTDDRIQNWKETSWQIHPILNMPELDPEAVQFALLPSDPLEHYRKILTGNAARIRREVEDEKDSMQREVVKRVRMTDTWDRLFKVTTGDQVHLLVAARSGKNEIITRTVVLSSNDPAGRKWLTTKIAYRDNKPICWCIPVDTAIGTSVGVELRHENAIDITKLYDEIVGAH